MGLFNSLFKSEKKSEKKSKNKETFSVEKMESIIPPSYAGIREKYRSFIDEVKTNTQDNATHAKKTKYEALRRQKAELDRRYADAMGVPVPTNQVSQRMANDRDEMQRLHDEADAVWEPADKKFTKNIKAHEELEKRRGTPLAQVVKHAGELKEKDDAAAAQSANAAVTQSTNTADTQTEAGGQTAETNKGKQKMSTDEKLEVTGFLATIEGYLGAIFGLVSDGLGTMKSLGADTKDTAEALKNGTKSKNNVFKEENSSASGVCGIGAAAISLFNALVAGIEMARSFSKTMKAAAEGKRDDQERWLVVRELLNQLCDVYGNMVGAVSPFTQVVPFLGSALSITVNGIQLGVGTMNLATNVVHAKEIREDKTKLWAEIERKRKKYVALGSRDVELFDVNAVPGKIVGSQKKDRKKSAEAVDKKRREMLKTVSGWMGIEKKVLPEGHSKNASEYADAEKNISTRISALRDKKHQGQLTDAEKGSYKHKMHAMEALELMSQYRTADKAQKKMHKSIAHDAEGIITSGVQLAGNATKLAGEITAGTGFGAALIAVGTGINMAESGYELGREAFSIIYAKIRDAKGANQNKENTRNEMAEYLFDKMVSLNPPYAQWNGDYLKMDDTVPDYKIREEGASMTEIHSILRRGLDAKISLLIDAPKASDMKNALAAAFSQDGNITFAQDGV